MRDGLILLSNRGALCQNVRVAEICFPRREDNMGRAKKTNKQNCGGFQLGLHGPPVGPGQGSHPTEL